MEKKETTPFQEACMKAWHWGWCRGSDRNDKFKHICAIDLAKEFPVENAAQALLEALQQMVNNCPCDFAGGQAIRDKARAAIAKAKGESL